MRAVLAANDAAATTQGRRQGRTIGPRRTGRRCPGHSREPGSSGGAPVTWPGGPSWWAVRNDVEGFHRGSNLGRRRLAPGAEREAQQPAAWRRGPARQGRRARMSRQRERSFRLRVLTLTFCHGGRSWVGRARWSTPPGRRQTPSSTSCARPLTRGGQTRVSLVRPLDPDGRLRLMTLLGGLGGGGSFLLSSRSLHHRADGFRTQYEQASRSIVYSPNRIYGPSAVQRHRPRGADRRPVVHGKALGPGGGPMDLPVACPSSLPAGRRDLRLYPTRIAVGKVEMRPEDRYLHGRLK